MTQKEFADAISKLLENDIDVNDAMSALIAHAVTIAIVLHVDTNRDPRDARAKLHTFIDKIFDDGIASLERQASNEPS